MKRMFTFAFAVALASLAACGGYESADSGTTTPEASKPAEKPTTPAPNESFKTVQLALTGLA